jgi:hypothetical protein
MYYGDLKQMLQQGNETMEPDTIASSSQASFGVPWYLCPFALVLPLFLGVPLALAFVPPCLFATLPCLMHPLLEIPCVLC